MRDVPRTKGGRRTPYPRYTPACQASLTFASRRIGMCRCRLECAATWAVVKRSGAALPEPCGEVDSRRGSGHGVPEMGFACTCVYSDSRISNYAEPSATLAGIAYSRQIGPFAFARPPLRPLFASAGTEQITWKRLFGCSRETSTGRNVWKCAECVPIGAPEPSKVAERSATLANTPTARVRLTPSLGLSPFPLAHRASAYS